MVLPEACEPRTHAHTPNEFGADHVASYPGSFS